MDTGPSNRSQTDGSPARVPVGPPTRPPQRAAGGRWLIGIGMALGFHLGLLVLARVPVAPDSRKDAVNPRVSWVGDKALLEEHTLRSQILRIGNDEPLFLVTAQNYAGVVRRGEGPLPPGQIFDPYRPQLILPVDQSPPGLVTAPQDRTEAPVAASGFRWPVLAAFGRADAPDRQFEPRRARIDVFSCESGRFVFGESLPRSPERSGNANWPDWRPLELFLTVSASGRVSEPIMAGAGSGSDEVDRFVLDYVRRRMRLDLRLGPGSYRVTVGP